MVAGLLAVLGGALVLLQGKAALLAAPDDGTCRRGDGTAADRPGGRQPGALVATLSL